jgi:signal transduction histidine kinase
MRILHVATALVMWCIIQFAPVPACAEEFATKDEAVALVHKAIARVAEVGIDKARPEFMDHGGKFIDRDLYLVVIDKDGIRVAHGQNPKLVGKAFYDAVDVNGKAYGKDVERIAEGPGTGWTSYVFKDPISGKLLPKENYVEKAGDYTYVAGVFTR